MVAFFKKIIVPPVFGADEDRTQIAALLNALAWITLVSALVFTLASPFLLPPSAHLFVLILPAYPLALIVLVSIHRGQVRLAGILLITGLWLQYTLADIETGGVGSPAYGGYVVIVLLAGLVFRSRASMVFAGFSIASGLAMLHAQDMGVLPQAQVYLGWARWFAAALFFVLAAVLLRLTSFSIAESLTRARQELAERKRSERALKESEERFRQLYEEAPVAYYSVNADDGRIRMANHRTAAMLGYALDDLIGRSVFDLYADSSLGKEKAHQVFERMRVGVATDNTEVQMCKADGSVIWINLTVRPVQTAEGKVIYSRVTAIDITERKHAEEQLLHDAFHDSLTGLPNRALFVDRLGRALERAKRSRDNRFAVLYLDFDRFKVVNDSLGHAVGDHLLVDGARRLELCVRAVDTVARLGGDEFVFLIEDVDGIQDAEVVADRIQHQFAQPFGLEGHAVIISGSIGIVLSTPAYDRPEEILRDADIAMYRAKALGKARYEIFESKMLDRARARLELETDLRTAIHREEFQLHYQPILNLKTRRITAFEALLRWNHPKWGIMAPSEFIPLAEETGLIIPIGHWVLRTACQQIREWQLRYSTQPPLSINVNLSARQFAQKDLVEQIGQILQKTALAPGSLSLEITESILLENDAAVMTQLEQLRVLGVQVQIDDFGTGYSSLSYLQRLPIGTFKIDRTFVNRVGVEGNGLGLLRTMLALAHDLGMKVVAEGIETDVQLHKLRELGCEFGQGYLFCKPVTGQVADSLIAESGLAREKS